MLSSYQRRVSFDSLTQNKEFEVDNPPHIPPQYEKNSPLYTSSSLFPDKSPDKSPNKRNLGQLDLNFGFDSRSKQVDVLELFNSFNEIGQKTSSSYSSSPSYKRKKIPKLPPPPKKSILKNNNNYANEFQSSLSAPPEPSRKKKSLVEMTTEELIAMDQQFRTGVELDKLKFDGDGYLPFSSSPSEAFSAKKPSSPSSVGSFGGSRQIKNIDKAVESMVNKKNIKDITSLNSYSASFKHNEMDKFLKTHFNLKDEEDSRVDDKLVTKSLKYLDYTRIIPESLRNVLVYISGRRHTWSAIDFSIKRYLRNGDQLIIVSRIPPRVESDQTRVEEDEDELCLATKEAIENLTCYIFQMIELSGKKDLKISIKLEFIRDLSVKNILKDAVEFHRPQVLILSSLLSNLYLSNQMMRMKLPVYVMKNLNTPTLVIPTLLFNAAEEDNVNSSQTCTKATDVSDVSIHVSNDNYERDSTSDELVKDSENHGSYLRTLNTFIKTIDPNIDFDPSTRQFQSRSSISYSVSTDRSETPGLRESLNDHSTVSYFPPSIPTIKFSEHLEVPRGGAGNVASGSSSRRNSNSQLYKVKSLLDEENQPASRSKSYSTTPVTPVMSNDEIKRRLSAQSAPSTSAPVKSSKKSGFFGIFKKKK